MVGMVNTMIGLLMMFSFIHLFNLSYWTSTFIGNSAGAVVSYFLNRSYTFNSNVSFQRGLPRFLIMILFCYFSAYFCSEQLAEWMGQQIVMDNVTEQNISVLVGSCLYTLSNYIGQKYFVFRKVKEFSY
jgi:putative flippase GtrA